MAVLAAILPLVSQASALALALYRLAATDVYAAKELLKTARAVSNLALIAKEIGTFVNQDDRLPSPEAFETIEDILDQCTAVLNEIDSLKSSQNEEPSGRYQNGQQDGSSTLTPHSVARLHYLKAHLESLRATLSVMLQTLHTAQSIMWAEVRPYVSPKQCATAVANEKQQLETLIIDQQMSILLASKLYDLVRPDARMLMEKDSSLSLSVIDESAPNPIELVKYQDKYLTSLDTRNSDESHWLASVCGTSKPQLDRLLERWTTLRQFKENLLNEKRKAQAEKRETQQAFVESDSEDEIDVLPKFAGSGIGINTPTTRTAPPLSPDPHSLPIPIQASSQDSGSVSASPRTSISTLPVEAAAAVEAKDKDEDLDLEIPWTLRTRRYYWRYIDGKIQESNTDMPTSEAFRHRHSWTEVQASWVCKDALKEAGLPYTQVQKEIPDGRRTKFETWFCIDRPLTFDEVQRLVERTVELYRKTQPPSPPPVKERARRTSFERRAPPPKGGDRDRTPLASSNKPPPLERSTTAYHISQPPPLDRTMSMPGQGPGQAPPQLPYPSNSRPGSLQMPPPSPSLPQSYSPRLAPQSMPQPIPSYSNLSYPPPPPPGPPRTFTQSIPTAPPRHLQPQIYSQSPLRSSLDASRHDYYSSTSGTSDSEGVTRSRKQRQRSRRRGSDSERRKKSHMHGKAGALMGVAGLTALLDGLVGI